MDDKNNNSGSRYSKFTIKDENKKKINADFYEIDPLDIVEVEESNTDKIDIKTSKVDIKTSKDIDLKKNGGTDVDIKVPKNIKKSLKDSLNKKSDRKIEKNIRSRYKTKDIILRPESIEDLNISKDLIVDGIVRHLYYSGNLTGLDISKRLKVPFNNIVETLLDQLLKQKLVFYEGGRGFGRSSMTFALTDNGRQFAIDSLKKNGYMGPLPVSLKNYKEIFKNLKQLPSITPKRLKELLGTLILPNDFIYNIGPAINSNHSIFLYGPPGNGKSVIADSIGKNSDGEITIPYAIQVDGQIIKVFDSIFHEVIEEHPKDPRWIKIKRPYVFVGGELTYDMLNLNLDPISKVYEAPLQLKANGGIFLIDDFGRQKEPPKLFLNRWIVPLENGFDVLNFSSGKSFTVPFEELIIFSTNLDPEDLVDDAFLRRIRYKIKIDSPTPDIFIEIFKKTCDSYKIPYILSDIENFFFYNRGVIPKIKAVLPRDIIRIIKNICEFENIRKEVNFYTLKKASNIGFIPDHS